MPTKKPAAPKKKPAPATKKAPAAAPKKPSAGGADTHAVFAALRDILRRHAPALDVKKDTDIAFYLDSRIPHKGKPLFFGAAMIHKSYVSYYFFPIYMCPELVDGLSPALRQRMQGKSCFNFKAVDDAAFAELAELTARGFERFRARGLI